MPQRPLSRKAVSSTLTSIMFTLACPPGATTGRSALVAGTALHAPKATVAKGSLIYTDEYNVYTRLSAWGYHRPFGLGGGNRSSCPKGHCRERQSHLH